MVDFKPWLTGGENAGAAGALAASMSPAWLCRKRARDVSALKT
jgi:hypothetical protein